MIRRTPLVAVALFLAGGATTAHAALLAAEPFDYPNSLGSSVNAQSGGTGFSAPWVNTAGDVTLATDNASLQYPANVELTEAGTRLDVTATIADPARASATRTLATPMSYAVGGQEFYSSALFNHSTTTGQISSVLFSDGTNLRWYYGIDAAGRFSVAMNPSDPTQRATTTAGIVPGETYLLVSKLRTSTTGFDEVFLEIFGPGEEVVMPATDADWDLSEAGGSGVIANAVRLDFTNPAGGSNEFDEFRLGTTFADVAPTTVVPEPASLSLLALAALGLVRRAPRRHAR